MADIKFSCPHCDQRITCDALWGGHELQCPSCQNTLTVPASAPPAPVVTARAVGPVRALAPPPGHTPKLSLGQSAAPAAAAESAPGPQRVIPIRNLTPPPQKKKGPLVKYASAAIILTALGVGGYFGYPWVKGLQQRGKAKQEAAEQNAGSVQAGAPGPKQHASGAGQDVPVAADGGTNAAGADAQALIPAVWTLDLGTAKIPGGKVNGMIAGTNFVLETARVDPVGTAQVLRLTQGQVASPDREVLIYLHLKAGEKLGGQSLAISREMMGSGVPQVAKRWKPNPRFAPQLKSFYNGYALKLELGQVADNLIPGKIFLALPDSEQTVVAGVFKATVPVIDPNAQPQPVVATPMSPGATDASRAAADDAFRRRYGATRQ